MSHPYQASFCKATITLKNKTIGVSCRIRMNYIEVPVQFCDSGQWLSGNSSDRRPPNWLSPNNSPGLESTEKLFYKQLALRRVTAVPRRSCPCTLPHMPALRVSSRRRPAASTPRCPLCPKKKIGKDLFGLARMFDKDAVVWPRCKKTVDHEICFNTVNLFEIAFWHILPCIL